MAVKNHLFIVFVSLITSSIAFSQKSNGSETGKPFTFASEVRYHETLKTPTFVQFDSKADVDTNAWSVIQQTIFETRPVDSWSVIRSETDNIGMVHKRFQQVYNGIEVEGQVFIFHSKNGKFTTANGTYISKIDVTTTASISAETAFESARVFSKIQVPFVEPKLVIIEHNKSLLLAYKCAVYSSSPLYNQSIYVDAQSGVVVKNISKLCSTDANGLGHTQFSGNQTITTDSISSTLYKLQETGRGGGIVTLKNSSLQPYEDTDNDWNNVNATLDEFATDVHWGAEVTYDFFFNNFGRNSFDNLGGLITSYTNDASVGVNAYWSGAPQNEMHYGNGDASYFPVASLEVAGHELTHGVTEYSANLIYAGESGALNESFSDIFGNTIRFINAPAVASWYIGDQLSRTGTGSASFRNMANPNEFGNADCYNGLYFNAGDVVHFDSGIQNFWYYLLCQGGTGTNDIGNIYNVTSIGMTDAMQIAYRNLAFYLTPNSTFLDARNGSEQAAIDLFGFCSPQQFQVIRAWYAVGVGDGIIAGEVTSNFSSTPNFACSAPLLTQFTSVGSYEMYAWDFGDGSTSTLQNPSHTYNSTGSFTVQLIVKNVSLCPGSDTLILPNHILIGSINPVSAFSTSSSNSSSPITFTDLSLYNPTAWNWNFGDGGTSTLQNPTHTYLTAGTYTVQLTTTNCAGSNTLNFVFTVTSSYIACVNTDIVASSGGLYDSGGPTGSYMNNEFCSFLIHPCSASTITLEMLELDIESGYDYIRVYDGSSNASPLIATYNGSNLQTPITANSGQMFIEFSTDGSIVGQGFHAEFSSVNSNNSTVANFTSSNSNPGVGETVSFQDLSTFGPSSWNWNFGDGTTSTLQNPTHIYAAIGVYTVQLNVSNCNGSDAYTSTINVNSNYLACQVSEIDVASGTIYDSGGPSGSYQDNENCSILINPCGVTSVTLQMQELSLETGYDYVRVYDGNSSAGILLATYTGTSLMGPVTANSGQMFIQFTSDGSVIANGFTAVFSSVITGTPVVANFSTSDPTPSVGQTINYTDLSSNSPTVWNWNFGDGSTSSVQNPSHVFTNPGVYSVRLIASNCINTGDTIITTYNVNTLGLDENVSDYLISVYPNPSSDYFVIQMKYSVIELKAELIDGSGRLVGVDFTNFNSSNETFTVSTTQLNSGNYILKLTGVDLQGNHFLIRSKVVVLHH